MTHVRYVQSPNNVMQRIKCSMEDHFFLRTPVPLVFFYNAVIPEEKIIGAIRQALIEYPLFAGRMSKDEGHLYIDCNNAGIKS